MTRRQSWRDGDMHSALFRESRHMTAEKRHWATKAFGTSRRSLGGHAIKGGVSGEHAGPKSRARSAPGRPRSDATKVLCRLHWAFPPPHACPAFFFCTLRQSVLLPTRPDRLSNQCPPHSAGRRTFTPIPCHMCSEHCSPVSASCPLDWPKKRLRFRIATPREAPHGQGKPPPSATCLGQNVEGAVPIGSVDDESQKSDAKAPGNGCWKKAQRRWAWGCANKRRPISVISRHTLVRVGEAGAFGYQISEVVDCGQRNFGR